MSSHAAGRRRRAWPACILGLLLGWAAARPCAGQEASPQPVAPVLQQAASEAAVDRFFAGCRTTAHLFAHGDRRLLDLHTAVYTVSNVMELEIVRLADWVIDLPVPGVELRPLEHGIAGIRAGYGRVNRSLPTRRAGELVDALQLKELSLGDVTTAQTVASGGNPQPGSGTVVRFNKLVDWMQHVIGDLNHGVGWLTRRPDGLITWSQPARVVDQGQQRLTRAFHWVTLLVAKMVDRGIQGAEAGSERVINVGRAAPHRHTTVFLRMPPAVFRDYERTLLRQPGRIYAGTPEELHGLTHQGLFHPARQQRLRRRDRLRPTIDRFAAEPPVIILVTDRRTFQRLPDSLQDYQVPADWAMGDVPVLPAGQ